MNFGVFRRLELFFRHSWLDLGIDQVRTLTLSLGTPLVYTSLGT